MTWKTIREAMENIDDKDKETKMYDVCWADYVKIRNALEFPNRNGGSCNIDLADGHVFKIVESKYVWIGASGSSVKSYDDVYFAYCSTSNSMRARVTFCKEGSIVEDVLFLVERVS